MLSRAGRWMLIAGAATMASTVAPIAAPAHAQGWDDNRGCSSRDRDRGRCDRDRYRGDWGRDRDRDRRERERDRRKDAKTDGIVAGVVGTAIIGGIIAAAASSNKKKDGDRDRRDYCESRYGNYDARTDTYRAADGRSYPCD